MRCTDEENHNWRTSQTTIRLSFAISDYSSQGNYTRELPDSTCRRIACGNISNLHDTTAALGNDMQHSTSR